MAGRDRVRQDWSAAAVTAQCEHDAGCPFPARLDVDTAAGPIRVCVRCYDAAAQHARARRWRDAGEPNARQSIAHAKAYMGTAHNYDGATWRITREQAIEHWHVVLSRSEDGSPSHIAALDALRTLGGKHGE